MPGVKFTVSEKDRGLRKLFGPTLDELKKRDPHVRVGIFAGEKTGDVVHEPGGPTNVELAAIHEYGVPESGIPERSFIRSTFEEQKRAYQTMLVALLPKVLDGKLALSGMFDVLGAQMVADINRKVRVDGVPPPLQQATIDRKGSSRALIDTGRMLAALTWVVVADDKKVSAG